VNSILKKLIFIYISKNWHPIRFFVVVVVNVNALGFEKYNFYDI